MTRDYLPYLTPFDIQSVNQTEVIQSLWSGYGELVRLHTTGNQIKSVIIKHVKLPDKLNHPRGWNHSLSHQRKVASYHVEAFWYQHYGQTADRRCLTPKSLRTYSTEGEWLIVMQDLSTLGFTEVVSQANQQHLMTCLKWLANFHAKHIGHSGEGLWPSGTYWHLQTRLDELATLSDQRLKRSASQLDQRLTDAKYQTLVHGDAKLANFCFTPDGKKAAAIDFQYVGRGCAMKDVALFISSAVAPEHCAEQEQPLLDCYFACLGDALAYYQPQLSPSEVEQAWRPLFAIAWADFQRFIKGWSPDHWKINPYTESLTRQALQQLEAYQDDN